MRTILVNSAKIINETTGTERNIANIMYTTAFCNLIRNGTLYKREMGIDGLPKLTITLGNTEYQCQEYLIEKLLNNNYVINPYEDTTKDYLELDKLPTPDFITLTAQGEKEKNNKKKKNENDTEPEDNASENESIEITISEDKQIEALLERADNYRLETVLNIALAIVCGVFAIAVMTFL